MLVWYKHSNVLHVPHHYEQARWQKGKSQDISLARDIVNNNSNGSDNTPHEVNANMA
jgi:hypothetical protein